MNFAQGWPQYSAPINPVRITNFSRVALLRSASGGGRFVGNKMGLAKARVMICSRRGGRTVSVVHTTYCAPNRQVSDTP